MNLVIIHYHLNRGGVTSVIRNHLHSLLDDDPQNVLILHGSGMDGWSDSEFASNPSVRRVCIESLGYRSNNDSGPDIFDDLESTLKKYNCDPTNSLLHFHNHNLGKNNFLLPAIQKFAKVGFRMLLQIHDFAEDMRPENFKAISDFCDQQSATMEDWLYPSYPNVHFAFLNHRDLSLASGSLVEPSKAHLLPNPVFLDPGQPRARREQVKRELGLAKQTTLVIYPVRAIRRKNVAEALLFAAANKDSTVGVTLPAKSTDEIQPYQSLVELSERLSLSVMFGIGTRGIEFRDLIHSADYFFTSSITEGFGMTFLESWLWGKPLIGRNLEPITRDFTAAGLDLSGMYEHVRIPYSWIDVEKELPEQQTLLAEVASQFSSVVHSPMTWDHEKRLGWVDFAKLTSATQKSIVASVYEDDSKRLALLQLNPRFTIPKKNEGLIERNRQVVKTNYMSHAFRTRFESILKQFENFEAKTTETMSSSGFAKTKNCNALVKEFLDPENFYPIRVQV